MNNFVKNFNHVSPIDHRTYFLRKIIFHQQLEFSAVNMRKAMPIPHKRVSKQNDISRYVVERRMYDLWYAGSGSPYI